MKMHQDVFSGERENPAERTLGTVRLVLSVPIDVACEVDKIVGFQKGKLDLSENFRYFLPYTWVYLSGAEIRGAGTEYFHGVMSTSPCLVIIVDIYTASKEDGEQGRRASVRQIAQSLDLVPIGELRNPPPNAPPFRMPCRQFEDAYRIMEPLRAEKRREVRSKRTMKCKTKNSSSQQRLDEASLMKQNEGGASELANERRSRNLTMDERRRATEMLMAGESIKNIARELNRACSTIYKLRRIMEPLRAEKKRDVRSKRTKKCKTKNSSSQQRLDEASLMEQNEGGASELVNERPYHFLTMDERRRATEMLMAGESITNIARELNTACSTIHNLKRDIINGISWNLEE